MKNIELLTRRFGPESCLSREKLLVRLVDDPRDVATSYGSGARYYPFAQEDIFHPKAYGGGARIWGFWKDGTYVDLAAIRDRDTRSMTYGDLAADIRFLLQIRSPWGDDSDASEEPFHEDYLLKALPPYLTYEKFLVVMDTILKAELVDRKLRIWKVPKDTSLSA